MAYDVSLSTAVSERVRALPVRRRRALEARLARVARAAEAGHALPGTQAARGASWRRRTPRAPGPWLQIHVRPGARTVMVEGVGHVRLHPPAPARVSTERPAVPDPTAAAVAATLDSLTGLRPSRLADLPQEPTMDTAPAPLNVAIL